MNLAKICVEKPVLSVLLVVVCFTGCGTFISIFQHQPAPPIQQAPPISCGIKNVALSDTDGNSYGYSHCDNTSGRCVYFIKYDSGPYEGQVFRVYNEDAEKRDQWKAYIIRDGEKYYLR
ncbi:MAG: hypothetical protein OXI43_12320 [Candidatus Poribacteria bacterium]|nr:hypothetical protein [Candidatus Poribacteria bacterium]